eukprot:197643_1
MLRTLYILLIIISLFHKTRCDRYHNTLLSGRKLLTVRRKAKVAPIKRFKEWSRWKDVEAWKQHQWRLSGQEIPTPLKESDKRPLPQPIDIDGEQKYYYVPPQFDKAKMRETVLTHWFEHKPIHLLHPEDHPINRNLKHPTIFWNGRMSNPLSQTSLKSGRDGVKYWTDDGPGGDPDNLWTVAFHDKNMDGHFGDLYWAIVFSFQRYHSDWEIDSTDEEDPGGYVVTKPEYLYGYIVVFEAKTGVIVNNVLEKKAGDLSIVQQVKQSGNVMGRTGLKGFGADGLPDAHVFTEEAQRKFGLKVLRIYLLDNSKVTDDGYVSDGNGGNMKYQQWNRLFDQVFKNPKWYQKIENKTLTQLLVLGYPLTKS